MSDTFIKSRPKSPGEVLGEMLDAKGIKQTELASQLGMNRTYLNQVINGRYPVSAELRIKLQGPLGVNPNYWAEVQRNYDLWQRTPEGKEHDRKQEEEDLYTMLDVRGCHVMNDFETESAIRSKLIIVTNLDFDREVDRARLSNTTLELTFGSMATQHVLTKHDDGTTTEELLEVSLKARTTFKRGQQMTFATHEALHLPPRFRMVVHGLADQWATEAIHYFGPRIVEQRKAQGTQAGERPQAFPVAFSLLNSTLHDLKLQAGEPCLKVSFEYIAQESTSHP